MARKVVIITGANRGLGKALCEQYLDQEETIVISLSRRESNEQQKLSGSDNFYFLPLDLSLEIGDTDLDRLKNVIEPEDKIIFINNASVISPIDQVGALNSVELSALLNVNARSVVVICNYLIKSYHNFEIDFVNISSGAAHRSLEHWSLYCSSKAFGHMFFETLKLEQQHEGIRVFQVDPGIMDTGMQAEIRGSKAPDAESFKAIKEKGSIVNPKAAAVKVLETIQ